MPTPTGTGTVTFRVVSEDQGINFNGSDSLTVRLRGEASLLSAASAAYTRYSPHASYPTMFLTGKRTIDRGPVAEIELTYTGYLESLTPDNGLISLSDDISLQTVQLTSDEDENITFSYRAQTTTWVWMTRSESKPEYPRFGIPVPSEIPTGLLFNPSPPKYDGSVASAYKLGSRLTQFRRDRIAPGLWTVTETWMMSIEPI